MNDDSFSTMDDSDDIITNDLKSYKNNPLYTNMNMNFLSNTNITNQDNLDDLDEEVDLTNVPEIPKSQIDDAEKMEKEKESPQIHFEPKVMTAEERKAALRRKLAEKKTARTGGRSAPQMKTQMQANQMQNQMQNLMNMPGMNEMMETMLKGDNLEKIMKQMPMNGMPNVDPEQMKFFFQTMNKK